MAEGRARLEAIRLPDHSGGRSAATKARHAAATATLAARQRTRIAATPDPIRRARPRTTRGTTRFNERMARPTVDPLDASLSSAPNSEGWA